MTTNRTTDSAQNDPPVTTELEILRQEVQNMRIQMEEQRTQFTNVLGQRVLDTLSTSNDPATTLPRLGQRPESFRGEKADRDMYVIKRWLDRMESYFEIAGVSKESEKIKLLRTYIVDWAGRELDIRIAERGPFLSCKELEEWLKSHYSTSDAINTYRDRFFGCRQQDDESIDDYFKRFREARGTLDKPLDESYVVYFFIRNLRPAFRSEIRKDRNFAIYEGVTLDDVHDQLKRVTPIVTSQLYHDTRPSSAQSNSHSDISNKRRKGNQLQPIPSTPQSSTQSSPAPLTPGTTQFIQSQVRHGDGNQFFDYVQEHPKWKTTTRQANLCYKRGSRQHHAGICTAPPSSPLRSDNAGGLNAILTDDSLIDLDLDPLNEDQQSQRGIQLYVKLPHHVQRTVLSLQSLLLSLNIHHFSLIQHSSKKI